MRLEQRLPRSCAVWRISTESPWNGILWKAIWMFLSVENLSCRRRMLWIGTCVLILKGCTNIIRLYIPLHSILSILRVPFPTLTRFPRLEVDALLVIKDGELIVAPLFLSMCCIGALYCFERDTSKKLHTAARKLIYSVCPQHSLQKCEMNRCWWCSIWKINRMKSREKFGFYRRCYWQWFMLRTVEISKSLKEDWLYNLSSEMYYSFPILVVKRS